MRITSALLGSLAATAVKTLQPSSGGADDWTNNSTKPIELVPAPWSLHGTVYSIASVLPPSELPVKAYGPLERSSPAYVAAADPVGPYDELLMVPGYFKYPHVDEQGRRSERLNPSITRIYVSQKYTAKNGRMNWNIPKHLAKFVWTDEADGSTTVKVYPHDTTGTNPNAESAPSTLPFFQTTFSPLLGGLPFSTDLYAWIGINATLAQPPLPGNPDAAHGELAGTQQWRAVVPGQASDRSSLGMFDMGQGKGDAVGNTGKNAVGDEVFPNFWPGMPRLTLGLKMENAKISFGEPEIWG
ncbi:hypothetical protein PG997_005491 [Apiospora hydei]|uniref:Uncharacterized protein n=1 Tax=Apiospora hydei TaxID=1337664 RepID=A0ABR1WKY5_9PEZI